MKGRWITSIGGLLVVCVTAFSVWSMLQTGKEAVEAEPEQVVETVQQVILNPQQVELAQVATESVRRESVREEIHVPGRLVYDEARHIAIKLPIDCILTDLPVLTGDKVTRGQVIAVVSSTEVGDARADMLSRAAERDLAVRRRDWNQAVAGNLKLLVDLLQKEQDLQEVERQLQGKSLGQYRQQLMSAYSQMLLARNLADNASPLAESGAVPGRVLQERLTTRQIAESSFRAACEQVRFDAELQSESSQLEVEDAERRFLIASKHLESLLGEPQDIAQIQELESLSVLQVKAPFEGTIEQRLFSQLERVPAGEPLMVVADTRTLWVEAQIRERDWGALKLNTGESFELSVPAIPERKVAAHVTYMGRQVDPVSQSVPLVGTIENGYGDLRPGMFVRVTLPIGDAQERMVVSPEAVLDDDRERFVFVSIDEHTFERRPVRLGKQTAHWVEILDGVDVKQQVVTTGSFILKSELLLAGEEE